MFTHEKRSVEGRVCVASAYMWPRYAM